MTRELELLIVCHASSKWGFGHLSRCLVIADAAARRGWATRLFARGDVDEIRRRSAGYQGPAHFFAASEGQGAELAALADVCEGSDDPQRIRLLVDHLHIDRDYAAAIAALGPWMTFRPEQSNDFVPTWLVVTRPGLDDPAPQSPPRQLLGPRYAVVKPAFAPDAKPYVPLARGRRLYVTFGGGDDFGASALLLPAVLAAGLELQLEIVTTRANSGLPEIRRLQAQHPEHVHLHLDQTEVAPIMRSCSAAITAGGTTTYELASLGIPFAAVALVANQEPQCRAWQSVGAATCLGPISQGAALPGKAVDFCRTMLENESAALTQRTALMQLVDHRGAERLFAAMEDIGDAD